MVDLVVARTPRILALTADSDVWQTWIDGHAAILDRPAAALRYRQIYVEARAGVERLFLDPK
jgi:hypothetical protein